MCGVENANEVLKAAQRLKYVFLAAVPPSFECGTSVGGRETPSPEQRSKGFSHRGPLPL